jgi:mRNA interferase MazF
MTIYGRGAVLFVHFPNFDLVICKKRPVLVIQDEHVETGLTQRLVAMITSNLDRTGDVRVLLRKNFLAFPHDLFAVSAISSENCPHLRSRERRTSRRKGGDHWCVV